MTLKEFYNTPKKVLYENMVEKRMKLIHDIDKIDNYEREYGKAWFWRREKIPLPNLSYGTKDDIFYESGFFTISWRNELDRINSNLSEIHKDLLSGRNIDDIYIGYFDMSDLNLCDNEAISWARSIMKEEL